MAFVCAVCRSAELNIFVLGGVRRGTCGNCLHEQRVDIETYDYSKFAMGATGAGSERIADQAAFLARHLPSGARLLEIGCANGLLARALRPIVPIQRYDGLELSPARAQASRHLDQVYDMSLPNLQAKNILPRESYDAVISSHCLEHIADPNAEIAAMRRALSPNGIVFIEVPNRSGHPSLPFDDNRSHLHFFSVSSLTRLLAAHGLTISVLETGAWHDARYPDCIRAIAHRIETDLALGHVLSDHSILTHTKDLIVWGAGKMASEILFHYFDTDKITFIVDEDERKHGTLCLGKIVKPPDAISSHPGCTILINSLEYGSAIRLDIQSRFADARPTIVSIEELLNGLLE